MPTIKAIIDAKFLSVCTASEAVGWLKEKRQGMKKLNSLARDDYTHEEAILAARNDPRGLYARAGVEGGYRGWRRERWAYRDRAVGAGLDVAAVDSGYRTRRLYAYAPTYDVGYTAAPSYDYAPGYDVAVTTGPYYAPGWNVAYAGPYYDYAPGVSFGIGIGPVGIGFGPAWGW
jgi:hypothetical protein